MSVLTLVRHGQATAFQKESDRLSEVGELQARKLAEFWLKNRVSFDEVYTGRLIRQIRTEQIVAEEFAANGTAWPVARALPGFNEYDAAGVLNRVVPALAARDERYAMLVQAFETARESVDRNRPFQRMFEIAMRAWARGEVSVEGVEPWPVFRGRVREALQRVMQGEANRRALVFTSGGPIGLSVQIAMHAPDGMFLEVNWRIRNCSLTEFVFSGDRFTLDSFNGVPHLDDMALWTYR
jgi:broad specificity phosphatase PhoE